MSLPTRHEEEDVLSFMLRQMQNLTSTVKRMRNVVKSRKDIFLKLKVLSFSPNKPHIYVCVLMPIV